MSALLLSLKAPVLTLQHGWPCTGWQESGPVSVPETENCLICLNKRHLCGLHQVNQFENFLHLVLLPNSCELSCVFQSSNESLKETLRKTHRQAGCTQDGPRISSSCERCERCDGAIHSYTFMHSAQAVKAVKAANAAKAAKAANAAKAAKAAKAENAANAVNAANVAIELQSFLSFSLNLS